MYSYEIANIVNVANIVMVCAAVVVAVCGLFVLINRKMGWTNAALFKKEGFFTAFCIAALIAFAAEATIFNLSAYLRFFTTGGETRVIGFSPDNPNVLLTNDGAHAIVDANGIHFIDFNREVTSVYVSPVFHDAEQAQLFITRMDEARGLSFHKKIYKYFPHSNYTPVYAHGKISYLNINLTTSNDGKVEIAGIIINKPIPFYFSGLRMLVVSFVIFALFILFCKKLRYKVSYFLFGYKFDHNSRKHGLVYAFVTLFLIIFVWVNVYTSVSNEHLDSPQIDSLMYNKYLVDAIIAGRTWLDAPPMIGNEGALADWVWYNGRWYSSQGIVPAVLLYVPYKLITGSYLSNQTGVFLFSAITVVLIALLWRFCVKKYMPNANFAFVMLGFLTLFFGCGLFTLVRGPGGFHNIVILAGIMFALAGVLLLFKSIENEKTNYRCLFFACLCLALVVGCRPNLVFVSLVVPFFLWDRKTPKLLVFIAIPYIVVAIPLMLYNYARFDSITEFGVRYVLSGSNATSPSMNILGNILKTFTSTMLYLFQINRYSIEFPFVENFRFIRWAMPPNIYFYNLPGSGIINFPIVFCLFYMIKNIMSKDRILIFNKLIGFLVAVTLMLFVYPMLRINFHGRYIFDFMVFLILVSLFSAWYYCNSKESQLPQKIRSKVIYVLCAATILVGLCLFVSGGVGVPFDNSYHFDPVLYHYLEESLGIIKR